MTDQVQAMRAARDALEYARENVVMARDFTRYENAIALLDAAIAQAEMVEPVAWEDCLTGEFTKDEEKGFFLMLNRHGIPYYTTPPSLTAVVQAALEKAASKVEEAVASDRELSAKNNGRQSDFAFGAVEAADRIVCAIRAIKPEDCMEGK